MTDDLRGTALGLGLGLVETIGETAGMHAADAMVKTANVTLRSAPQPGCGIITATMRGEASTARAAIEAGVAAASTVGKIRAAHVTPRPHEEVEDIIERPCVR